jgi:hypothetical protein
MSKTSIAIHVISSDPSILVDEPRAWPNAGCRPEDGRREQRLAGRSGRTSHFHIRIVLPEQKR